MPDARSRQLAKTQQGTELKLNYIINYKIKYLLLLIVNPAFVKMKMNQGIQYIRPKQERRPFKVGVEVVIHRIININMQ